MTKKAPALRRKRNPRETQLRIIEAARVEFSSHGFEIARIDLIAEGAGVSRQLVYTYFGSKAGLYKAVLDAESERASGLLQGVDYNGPIVPALELFSKTVFDYWRRSAMLAIDTAAHDGAWLKTTSKVYGVTAQFNGQIDKVFERGKAEGIIDPTADSSSFYAMATMAAVGTIVMGDLGPAMRGTVATVDHKIDYWRDYCAEMMIRSVLISEGRRHPGTAEPEPRHKRLEG